jgi:hypothetical protein
LKSSPVHIKLKKQLDVLFVSNCLSHGIPLLSARSKISNQYNLPKVKGLDMIAISMLKKKRTKKEDRAACKDYKNSKVIIP